MFSNNWKIGPIEKLFLKSVALREERGNRPPGIKGKKLVVLREVVDRAASAFDNVCQEVSATRLAVNHLTNCFLRYLLGKKKKPKIKKENIWRKGINGGKVRE